MINASIKRNYPGALAHCPVKGVRCKHMNMPTDVLSEIVSKRTQPSSQTDTQTESVATTQNDDASGNEDVGNGVMPENGQSIAQLAEAADDDDFDTEDTDDADAEKHNKPANRGIKNVINMKRELREERRSKKELEKRFIETTTKLDELINVLAGSTKQEQRDAIDEYAEEYGLDPEGVRKLVKIMGGESQKTLTTPNTKDTEVEKAKNPEKHADDIALQQQSKIKNAVAIEFEEFISANPSLKGKISLNALTAYIMSDKENLDKTFSKIVGEVYPGMLRAKSETNGTVSNDNSEKGKIDINNPENRKLIGKDKEVTKAHAESVLERYQGIYHRRPRD